MKQVLLAMFAICIFAGCSKENDNIGGKPTQKTISGYVQKGPFITGTSIKIQELNDQLAPTGKSFETQITKDDGSFVLNSELSYDYVEVIATGFYYNEVAGDLSDSPIMLRTISKISANKPININVLTTLQHPRMKRLISGGMSFEQASKQSQQEVLATFGIREDMTDFDQMNLMNGGNSDAILLLISSIMQDDRSESELSELVSKISSDIEDNGKLDQAIQQKAIKESYIEMSKPESFTNIRQNLRKRYKELGIDNFKIPNYYSYLDSDNDGTKNGEKPYILFEQNQNYWSLTPTGGKLEVELIANCDLKVTIPAGVDWVTLESSSKEKLVLTFTENTTLKQREAILKITSADQSVQCDLQLTQEVNAYFLLIRLENEAGTRTAENFYDEIVSDITVIGFSENGELLFSTKEKDPSISYNEYRCFPKIDKVQYKNCTIFTMINSPYDFSSYKGNLNDFMKLQSNIDLTKVKDIEHFQIAVTNKWTIDNAPVEDDGLEITRALFIARLTHPFAKVVFDFESLVEQTIGAITLENVWYDNGSFLDKEATHFTPKNLTLTNAVNNQYTAYLYHRSPLKNIEVNIGDRKKTITVTDNYIVTMGTVILIRVYLDRIEPQLGGIGENPM